MSYIGRSYGGGYQHPGMEAGMTPSAAQGFSQGYQGSQAGMAMQGMAGAGQSYMAGNPQAQFPNQRLVLVELLSQICCFKLGFVLPQGLRGGRGWEHTP